MKRPAITIFSIAAVLIVGLATGWQFRDKLSFGTRSSAGPAARSAIQASLELLLPPSATDVHCFEQELEKTHLLFARFDLDGDDVAGILDRRRASQHPTFPATAELKTDDALFTAMAEMQDQGRRAFWQPQELRQAQCAQKLGQRGTGVARVKWRLLVCTGPLDLGRARIYIAFSEEPAGDGK